MPEAPTISIVMPVFNGAKYLRLALIHIRRCRRIERISDEQTRIAWRKVKPSTY